MEVHQLRECVNVILNMHDLRHHLAGIKGPLSRENRDVMKTWKGGLLGPAAVPGTLVLAFC